jgi:hypothetical protein
LAFLVGAFPATQSIDNPPHQPRFIDRRSAAGAGGVSAGSPWVELLTVFGASPPSRHHDDDG